MRNRLPDPGPGPKLVEFQSDLQSFVNFASSSLDVDYRWRHHCERTLSVHIDLVDLEAASSKETRLAPEDERLLKWDSSGAAKVKDREHSFFRQPELMSNDLSKSSANRSNRSTAAAGPEAVSFDLEAALGAAVASFEGAAAFAQHPSKPNLTVEWSLPLLPDTLIGANEYRYVSFDDDAPPKPRSNEALVVNWWQEQNPTTKEKILLGKHIVPTDAVDVVEGRDATVFGPPLTVQMHLEAGGPGDLGQFVFVLNHGLGHASFVELNRDKVYGMHFWIILLFTYTALKP